MDLYLILFINSDLSEFRRITKHGINATKEYVEDFYRVLLLGKLLTSGSSKQDRRGAVREGRGLEKAL